MGLFDFFSWPFKVNKALAGMGVPPMLFEGQWRSEMQQLGKAENLTPEETALVMIAHGLGIGYPDDTEIVMAYHHANGEIDYEKPMVKAAMRRMGFMVSPF